MLAFLFFSSCKKPLADEVDTYKTVFESTKGEETATYEETISFYIRLAKEFPEINIQTIGETDSGFPLHVVTFNPDGDFNFDNVRKEKAILLINNGIHPGESDGIDATMLLYRDLAIEKLKAPKNTVLVTIPIYNIGGALNRNSTTRVNQNGPKEYGFRGNALNYDLNRDFVKMDTKNAKTFTQIFHLVKPDVFIDNHVSNGADYQYTLTHLFTQHNKLGGELGSFLHKSFIPEIEKGLSEKEWDITPYVNVFNRPPELGFSQFMDHPRYSTGYTTLWNTLGFMVETHMLKPYAQRVEGTLEIMKTTIDVIENEYQNIKKLRTESLAKSQESGNYYFNWQVDTTQTSTLNFKGYEAEMMDSEVTGLSRLKYHKDKPFTKEIQYQNFYYPKDTVPIPEAYLIKKGQQKVLDRFDLNNITYFPLETDTVLQVETYRIVDFSTRKNPYEGHYLHYNTQVEKSVKKVHFSAGDYLVPTKQDGIRYIMETLEPQGVDSFFNWNFFDTILQQKEGFSPYVFEDLALDLLKKDSVLRETFLLKKQLEPDFAENWYTQLDWIYQHSPYSESAYLRYPVYRIARNSAAASLVNLE
ncbi:M14 family metallopeptidase [Flagellimonas meridianipacifica]|uniref:M14 family metallopeptidase n=1 Tax=Flagellimonas meridianipacifica TaxID=1080225 RepID=UPI001FE892AF|nr:M14 family metallopeptidase [Allomuricauda pacifica]